MKDTEFAVRLLIAREVHHRSQITPFKRLSVLTGIPVKPLSNLVQRMVREQRQKVIIVPRGPKNDSDE